MITLEQAIERALRHGKFIPYEDTYAFVSRLEGVEERVRRLIASDPVRAVRLYEDFLAGCTDRADGVDDSDGDFVEFTHLLIDGWILARQAAGENPTVTARALVAWMNDDPHCFFYDLETHAIKLLDPAGLKALECAVRQQHLAAVERPAQRGPASMLRAIFVAQDDLEAYVTLAEETGLTSADCHTIAKILAGHGKPEKALAWIERGVSMEKAGPVPSSASHDLTQLRRELLVKLGREDEVVAGAWQDYTEDKSVFRYRELMGIVPESERPEWHARAMQAADDAKLADRISLYTDAGEENLLAALVRSADSGALETISHFITEPAARKLEPTHPDAAAVLWRAQGLRIVDSGRSPFYREAVRHLQRARLCFERAGLESEWEATARRVRANHSRKARFMAGFERVVPAKRKGSEQK